MILRGYQQEGLDSVFTYFAAHPDPTHNPVVAMPTGTGKSPVIGSFCHKVLSWWPGQRILMLVHVKELVEQNAKTLRRIWPQAPLGIFSAGLGERVAHMPITFAGVKSVARNLNLFGPQHIILVDEAHLIPEHEESDYLKVIAYFRALNPHVRVVGFSATPYRMGLGMITDGKIFSHVCFDITGLGAFNRLLDEGYLAPLIPIQTDMVIDVSKVKKQGGEFIASALQAAVDREELTRQALTETVRVAADRKHWLIFAAGVEHVMNVHKMLTEEFGVSASYIHSKTSDDARDEALRKFKAGEVRACVNANILTTGYDHPELDCIVCLRPTNSVVLHVQLLGRGTRPFYADGFDLSLSDGRLQAIAASPKQNCLVLDFAGNVSRLGPINDPRIPKKKGEGTGDIPVKLCLECNCLNHISARFCAQCNEPFPINEKITGQASTADVIARQEPPKVLEFDVSRVVCQLHPKPGQPTSLKVSYYCGIQRFTEWIHFERSGPIHNRAVGWWHARSDAPVPTTSAQALAQERSLRIPRMIRVWVNKTVNGKNYPEIMSWVFD